MYGTVIDSYFKNRSSSTSGQVCTTNKQALIGELAKKLNACGSRRAEQIFRTTLRCLCTNLSKEEVRALTCKLPDGMKGWVHAKKDASSDLYYFLAALKDSCGFRSMEESLGAAKEAISVLGCVIDLAEFAKPLPEELRELALQVKEEPIYADKCPD